MDGGYSPNPRSGFAVEGNEKLSSRFPCSSALFPIASVKHSAGLCL